MTSRAAAVLFLLTSPLLAQTNDPKAEIPPAQEVAPHDITQVDAAPLEGAIAVPLPEQERKRLEKYDMPELVGSRQALGSQLVDDKLPKPIVDYLATEGNVQQRLSMFEGGLVVVNVTGVGATIRKKLIIPDDALQTYRKAIAASALAEIRPASLPPPQPRREGRIRVYDSKGNFVERVFDPIAALPKPLNDQLLPLQDLLRAICEDRGVTNTVAGYMPAVGDQLVADDRKVYRVTRVIEKHIVELRCINQPTTIYVDVKDLYNYFIGTTGAAKQ